MAWRRSVDISAQMSLSTPPNEFTADTSSDLLGLIATLHPDSGLDVRESMLAPQPLLAETFVALSGPCAGGKEQIDD